MINYSIIIPTYRENKQLNKCLEWLKKYNLLPHVIVVDDNEEDYVMSLNCQVKSIKTGGGAWWSGSVNLGLQEAIKMNSQVVVLLNSDNWAEYDIIRPLIEKVIREAHMFHAATVVSQVNVVRCTTGYLDLINNRVSMYNHKKNIRDLGNGVFFGNYNGGMAVAFSLNILNIIGFLDEHLLLSADREFFYRAFQKGIPVCSYEKLVVFTDDRHKAINRSWTTSNRYFNYIHRIFNKRSPSYWRTTFYMYKKYTKFPRILTILSIIRYLSNWKRN